MCYGGSRGGAQASSVLPTPECQTFFLRFSLLLCACHRPRPAWALPPSPSSAFAPANAAFSSRVRKRQFFASAQLLVCPPSAVFSCPSCLCHRLRLTRQSRGRRISGRSSPHTASRGAPHFYVRGESMRAPAVAGHTFLDFWYCRQHSGCLFRRKAHYKAVVPDALEVSERHMRPNLAEPLLCCRRLPSTSGANRKSSPYFNTAHASRAFFAAMATTARQ